MARREDHPKAAAKLQQALMGNIIRRAPRRAIEVIWRVGHGV